MIRKFNKTWEQDCLIKSADTLQAVTDRRIAALESREEYQECMRQSDGCKHCQWEEEEVMTTKPQRANLRTKMRMRRGLDLQVTG